MDIDGALFGDVQQGLGKDLAKATTTKRSGARRSSLYEMHRFAPIRVEKPDIRVLTRPV
jgi:hypothetical protein